MFGNLVVVGYRCPEDFLDVIVNTSIAFCKLSRFLLMVWISFQTQDLLLAQGTSDAPLTRIAFGSCATQQNACPIWNEVNEYKPDLLLLLGDNIYADVVDGRLVPSTPERIREAYELLRKDNGFAQVQKNTPIMAVWDDHDFGNNDAGVEWVHKDVSAEIFHDFFGTPKDSPKRKQQGLYDAKIIGPTGKRTQIILLDTRYFRTELKKSATPLPGTRTIPYETAAGPEAQILGETQWKWLEEQLKQPAEVRIIGSSIQVLSDEHPYEKWANFPEERERLYQLIRKCEASGVILLSGDRHLGEISLDTRAVGYPLHDITASGLNQANKKWRTTEVNSKRLAALQWGDHFGTIEIDWTLPDPMIRLQLREESESVAVQTRFPLSVLKAPKADTPAPAGVLAPQAVLSIAEGERVEVQMLVKAGRAIRNPDRILLNSQLDFRQENNLTAVFLDSAAHDKWDGATLESFLNKTIRFRGKVTLYNGRKQVEISHPNDLEIVDP